jgi:hypothetical protein
MNSTYQMESNRKVPIYQFVSENICFCLFLMCYDKDRKGNALSQKDFKI